MVKGQFFCGQLATAPPTALFNSSIEELRLFRLFLSRSHESNSVANVFSSIGISSMASVFLTWKNLSPSYLTINVSSALSPGLKPAHIQYAEPAAT
jgi:hypothetical protein